MTFWDHTLQQLLVQGGPLMYPLLACSVFSVALIVDRTVAHIRFRLDYRAFVRELQRLIEAGKVNDAVQLCTRYASPIARTAEAYLRYVRSDEPLRSAAVQREGSESLELVEKRQRGLSAIANIATLTGLLGTVVGLVEAFHQIERAGGQVQPSDLASGIWQALLTTVFGLMIAIPSFAAFHLFESRADRIARRMEFIVLQLDQLFGKHTRTPEPEPAAQPVAGIREE